MDTVLNKPSMVLRYPGSKWRIADWIIGQMPEHHSYVDPFFGGGSILLCKPPSKIETVNDLDHDVVNLFQVIRDRPDELIRAVEYTPYARREYDQAFQPVNNPIEQARRFLVRCWQGHGFRTNGYKPGWKHDVQGREAAYSLRNWHNLPDRISAVVSRLKEIQIENSPALDVIRRFNFDNVLIYCDPPYLLSTRSGKSYRHEMTDDDHVELLETLLQHKGAAMISSYDNDLYNTLLKGWSKNQIHTTAEYGTPRLETLWMNCDIQIKLF